MSMPLIFLVNCSIISTDIIRTTSFYTVEHFLQLEDLLFLERKLFLTKGPRNFMYPEVKLPSEIKNKIHKKLRSRGSKPSCWFLSQKISNFWKHRTKIFILVLIKVYKTKILQISYYQDSQQEHLLYKVYLLQQLADLEQNLK